MLNQTNGGTFEATAMEWLNEQALKHEWGGRFFSQEQTAAYDRGPRDPKTRQAEALLMTNGVMQAIFEAKSGALNVAQQKVYLDNLAIRGQGDPAKGYLVFLVPVGTVATAKASAEYRKLTDYVRDKDYGARVEMKFVEIWWAARLVAGGNPSYPWVSGRRQCDGVALRDRRTSSRDGKMAQKKGRLR